MKGSRNPRNPRKGGVLFRQCGFPRNAAKTRKERRREGGGGDGGGDVDNGREKAIFIRKSMSGGGVGEGLEGEDDGGEAGVRECRGVRGYWLVEEEEVN